MGRRRGKRKKQIPTVHALRHGFALCGFGAEFAPGDWPEGHVWESWKHFPPAPDDGSGRYVACQGCLTATTPKPPNYAARGPGGIPR